MGLGLNKEHERIREHKSNIPVLPLSLVVSKQASVKDIYESTYENK